ncbi:hypothetical protein FOPG_18947 [Fusarium oxysporum f. sp. conglutinans race 2 54008]|uniref:Uncharacterized protein n=1 Tax=Fusarium oxysporum f. sp. conglutinans race 2 54008 TaxID=1089457 RepID=X0GNG0_FUSOX|nr:hypothetical protein FOPG_18947 [Fusarium oxysporum f. sp. conglutinans race 2 54008]
MSIHDDDDSTCPFAILRPKFSEEKRKTQPAAGTSDGEMLGIRGIL